jgi:aryl sulfotransferase
MDGLKPEAGPAKTRELIDGFVDSTPWNDFRFRDNDIVVASPAKAGTTWTLALLVQLLHGAPEVARVGNICRWIDFSLGQQGRMEAVEAQTHRRVMKSHLPADALVISPRAKYIFVARDGRDVAWSEHNHMLNSTDEFFQGVNAGRPKGLPEVTRPSGDVHEYYRDWMSGMAGMGDFWGHVRSWWALRDQPNVYMLHYQNLKDDLAGRAADIARYLGIEVDSETMTRAVEHAGFAHMKARADEMFPGLPVVGGAQTFINKGSNGRWREVLSAQEVAAYEARAIAELGPDGAAWLATGRL